MAAVIGPEVAQDAVALRRSNTQLRAIKVLDACLHGCTGCVFDFGGAELPGTEFAQIVAEAFDPAGAADWAVVTNPEADPELVAALHRVWVGEVLPKFAQHFGLALAPEGVSPVQLLVPGSSTVQ